MIHATRPAAGGGARSLAAALCLAALFLPAAAAQSPSLAFLDRLLGEAQAGVAAGTARIAGGRILLTDDPASYAIYDRLEAQVRGLAAIIGNQRDLLSYYGFEDSLLGDMIDSVQRIRELAVEESDGILSPSDREGIEAEMGQLYEDVLDSLGQARFNGVPVFAGVADFEPARRLLQGPEHYSIDAIDRLLATLVRERTAAGSRSNALDFSMSGQAIEEENESGAYSLGDTDVGAAISSVQTDDLLALVDLLMLRSAAR